MTGNHRNSILTSAGIVAAVCFVARLLVLLASICVSVFVYPFVCVHCVLFFVFVSFVCLFVCAVIDKHNTCILTCIWNRIISFFVCFHDAEMNETIQ